MTFYISKIYNSDNWIELNLTDENNNEKWEQGIKIIRDRFESRFLDIIHLIKNNECSGFLLMSIYCLLIETLMQFYLGEESTDKRFIGSHWRAFRDFFQQSDFFKDDFKTDKICRIFYSHFRCGLLHQAETKGESKIKIQQEAMLKVIKNQTRASLIIDRGKFHNCLSKEIESYFQNLLNNKKNYLGENLRINALKKMNLICKVN